MICIYTIFRIFLKTAKYLPHSQVKRESRSIQAWRPPTSTKILLSRHQISQILSAHLHPCRSLRTNPSKNDEQRCVVAEDSYIALIPNLPSGKNSECGHTLAVISIFLLEMLPPCIYIVDVDPRGSTEAMVAKLIYGQVTNSDGQAAFGSAWVVVLQRGQWPQFDHPCLVKRLILQICLEW